jgi:hypothetical protein
MKDRVLFLVVVVLLAAFAWWLLDVIEIEEPERGPPYVGPVQVWE